MFLLSNTLPIIQKIGEMTNFIRDNGRDVTLQRLRSRIQH